MQRDFYQVLGVPRTATHAEIRATYVRLVKRHHPDRAGRLPVRLHDVQQAYRCLADPARRAEHDYLIASGERAHRARQRSVQRRLNRYDRRQLVRLPRKRHQWRTMLVVTVGVVLIARMSIGLF